MARQHCGLSHLHPPAYLFQRRLAFRSRRSHISAFPRYCGIQAASVAVSALASEGILMTAAELRAMGRHLPGYRVWLETASLLGWTSNLLLVGQRMTGNPAAR